MDMTRRTFLRTAGSLLALVASPVFAGMPVLRETEPDAVTLEYTPDSSRLDASAHPAFQPGSRCARCYFFQGRDDSDVAPCSVFSGWRVSPRGWCREFTPRS